jgi:hypothetical protein
MKSFPAWNKKERLLRIVIAMACLLISSLLLLAYQFKLSIVDGVPRGGLFLANAIITFGLLVGFQLTALACNRRLKKKES